MKKSSEFDAGDFSSKLNGCPFCGKAPSVWETDPDDFGDCHIVIDCCCQMESVDYNPHKDEPSRAEASKNLVKDWNQRADAEETGEAALDRAFESGQEEGIKKCRGFVMDLAAEAFRSREDVKAATARELEGKIGEFAKKESKKSAARQKGRSI